MNKMKEELKKLADSLERSFSITEDTRNFLAETKLASGSIDKAFRDFLSEFKDKSFAIIGTLALNTYIKNPRSGIDLDLLFESEEAIKDLFSEKFIRIKPHHLLHKETGVKIDLITPVFLRGKISDAEASEIVSRAKDWVALPEDLLKLKVISGRPQDIADVVCLIKAKPQLFDLLKEFPESKTKTFILEDLQREPFDEE